MDCTHSVPIIIIILLWYTCNKLLSLLCGGSENGLGCNITLTAVCNLHGCTKAVLNIIFMLPKLGKW